MALEAALGVPDLPNGVSLINKPIIASFDYQSKIFNHPNLA
jgi:hypothetical protein